jgi:hypothetical protein
MSVSPHDGAAASGLIIPENIPGDDLSPTVLEEVATTLRTAGTGAVEQAELAETAWAGMPAALESPQGPVIYSALGSPSTAARTVETKFDRVADALEAYAAALRPIKDDFAAIKRDAVDFRATITWDERVWISPGETKEYEGNALTQVSSSSSYTSYSQPRTLAQVLEYLRGRGESARSVGGRAQILAHWTESSEHIDQNNALVDRLADAYTRLQNAEADCANAINGQREVCVAEVVHIEAWQLKQSGDMTVVLPWGSRVDEDRNCGESFWWGAGNAGKEALEGVGGLFGYNGMRGDWTLDQAGQSWLGAVQGIGALLVITSPPLMILGMAGVPVLSEGVNMGQDMLKGLVAWDTWSENPAEAAGRVVVNVGSMFIPGAGQVAAAVKALSAGSRIVDLAGDAARLTDATTTGLNKVDGLTTRLDGLAGDAVGTGLKVDELVVAGVRMDFPDSDALHVGVRTNDGPPSAPVSFVDDGAGGGAPRRPLTDDAPAPPTRVDEGGTSRPAPPSDGPSAPANAPDNPGNGSDTPGSGPDAPGNGPDAPGNGPDAPGDGPEVPPGNPADDPPPAGGPDTPPPPHTSDVDPRSLDRTDPELGNNPDGTWDGKPGLHLDAADNAAVQRYATESVAIEGRVRPELERVLETADPDARLVGLDESVKFADSLKGKVAQLMLEDPNLTVTNALAQVKDSVRYTVESPGSAYTSTVARTVEQLRASGFELVKFNDSWATPGYKGINSSWVDPSTGRLIEVQFHTPESFIVKTMSHDVYDQLRTPGLPADEIARLERLTEESFADLDVPPGAGNLGERFFPGSDPLPDLGPTPDGSSELLTGGSVRPRDLAEQTAWAARIYDEIRADASDVSRIAAHSEILRLPGGQVLGADDIAAIKRHVFEAEHVLEYPGEPPVLARFDPDADQAAAWLRLADGEATDLDRLFLHHEHLELNYLREHPGAPYREAHAFANQTADWYRALMEARPWP